jgi:hypothetical protein
MVGFNLRKGAPFMLFFFTGVRTIRHVRGTAVRNYVLQMQAGLPMECGSWCDFEREGAESGYTLEIWMIQLKAGISRRTSKQPSTFLT